MRHRRAGRKLGRDSAHRRALYANLAGALIEHGRIRTTEAKAKEVRPIVEEILETAKRAPSGGNLQPWHVDVLSGEALAALIAKVQQSLAAGGLIFSLASLAVSLWALVELGFLRGTAGPNRYGPDPLVL